MSQIAMTVIDAERSVHGEPHASFTDVVVACLSAEPETIAELAAAVPRFERREPESCFSWWSPGVREEPYDAGVCIVDLAARVVAAESTYSIPSAQGSVAYHDGRHGTDVWLPYHVSGDWLFLRELECWEPIAAQRRGERRESPPQDDRRVLYGKVSEFLVKECLALQTASGDGDDWRPPAGWEFRELPERVRDDFPPGPDDAVAEIHARWLMTPRKDLAGRTPRDVLLEKRDFLVWDLQDRCEGWTRLGECPPPLSTDSAAYRFAGFGPHENYVYYDLLRHLIGKCRERLVALNAGPDAPLSLQMEIAEWLNGEKNAWLHAPQGEFSGRTPAKLIENERRRIPEASTGAEAAVDDDCPLCRMMADDSGPYFWHLDGCNNDDDFPFSSHPTRAAWEKQQAEWREFNRRFAEEQERRRLQAFDDVPFEPSGFVDFEEEPPLYVSLFELGARLAEVIAAVREQDDCSELVDALNRRFDNLRDVLQQEDEALLEPVVSRLCEELQCAADVSPGVAEECADLEHWLRRIAEEGLFDPPDDDDFPF